MLRTIAVVLVAAAIAAGATSAQSSALAPTLTGQMTKLHYLVGTWTCRTRLPPADNMPARTHMGTASFEIEPGNTISFGVSAAGYSASGYMGYLDAKKMWWSAGSDNIGGITFETGTTTANGVTVMSGSSLMGGASQPTRDTISKVSDTRYEDLYQMEKGGKWVLGADSVCSKTSNTPD